MLCYDLLDREVKGKTDKEIIFIYTEHIEACNDSKDFPMAYSRLFHRRGKMFCKVKAYNEALKDLNIAVKYETSTRFNVLSSRAVIHNLLKDYNLALIDYQEALSDVDKHIDNGEDLEIIRRRIIYGIAQTNFNLKNYQKSIECFEQVYFGVLPEKLTSDFTNYGVAYYRLGNYEMAEKVLKACDKGSPDDYYPKIFLASIYIIRAEKNLSSQYLENALLALDQLEKLKSGLRIVQSLRNRCQLLKKTM